MWPVSRLHAIKTDYLLFFLWLNANQAGPLELSNVPKQEFKQGSAVTDDEDSLKMYSGSKLLTDKETNGPRRRTTQQRTEENQLMDTALNGGGDSLLGNPDSDSDG